MNSKDVKKTMNWDLGSYFPSFGGREMTEFKERLRSDINLVYEMCRDESDLKESNIECWKDILIKNENILERFSHLRSYIGCLVSADSNNQSYLREEAEASILGSEIEKIEVEILRSMKSAGSKTVEALKHCDELRDAEYYIERLNSRSQVRMSAEKEKLRAELDVDGINAWSRLYNTMSSKLEFEMEYPDGTIEKVPMSRRRSLMQDEDRRIRKAAFDGGNKSWQSVDYIAAAALNSIGGTRLTINRHRGVDHFLDSALFQSSVSRDTLEAMFEAIYRNIEIPRSVLKYKAQLLGQDRVSWYDIDADLDTGERMPLHWNDAMDLVVNSVSGFYPAFGDFARTVCENNWIESEPRSGKRPGGFCTTSLLSKESRIFMTYGGSLGDVMTLVHETGHAYHSYILGDMRTYRRFYPMTLAETASTFAEMLLTEGIARDERISDNDMKHIMNTELSQGAIFLLDIPVRYEFEKTFYEGRQKGVVSVDELYQMMKDTQKNVFGEVLEECDPCFWMSKLHFYISGITFYNFPYTFGYLLSRALFYRFKQEGSDFIKRYEHLLRISGSYDCERVVLESIGEDITRTEFWETSVRSLGDQLEDFMKTVS